MTTERGGQRRAGSLGRVIRPVARTVYVRTRRWLADDNPRAVQPPDIGDVSSLFAWCRARGVSQARPQYLWSVLRAARTAKNLGIERISAIEFGVAGGNGLLALESAAEATEALLGIAIETYGFDSGAGLPQPQGVKDAPFGLQAGFFGMDEHELRTRLTRSHLVLGRVEETVDEWLREDHPAVGAISFDLDYYSATMHAFGILAAPQDRLLPRVVCYFDDILGYIWSDFNGERAAIAEFNAAHDSRKISQIHGLRHDLPPSDAGCAWNEQIFVAHCFEHELYAAPDGLPTAGFLDLHRLGDNPHPSARPASS